jgi:hypothetical protein
MLRGSSPITLSQLDISPAIQAGALEAQAAVNLASSVNQAVQNFQAKQQEKEQKKMTANALRQFIPGLEEEVYGAIAKDPQILKSMSDLTNIQAAQQEQEILAQEQQRVQEQRDILEKAIMPNTDTSGLIDKEGVKRTFIQLGGTDESVLGLFNTPGEIKISETGVITQDGKFMGQLPQSALPPKPKTEDELKESRLRLEILEAERDLLLKELSEGVTGTIDTSLLSDADLEAYNEAIKNPTSEDAQEFFRLILQQQQANQ